jgi:ABC-type transport system substrate-binding protein
MKSSTKMRLIGVVASISVLGMALAGCSTQAVTPVKHVGQQGSMPVYGNTLTLDVSTPFPHLDPVKAYDTTSGEAVQAMYDQLVTYKSNTNEIVPDLATYSISPDGKTYTFKLKDAKFWNGHKVTAESFIKEFELVLTKANGSGGAGFVDTTIVGAAAFENGKAKSVSGLVSLDGGKTLQIKLNSIDPTFLYKLAMTFFSAVDPAYVNANTEKYIDYHPMGTGAFELTKYKPNVQWTFTKNPNYFQKGLPYLNSIVFNNISSPQIELFHYKQGQTGMISWNISGIGVPNDDYLTVINSPLKSQTVSTVQVATDYIGLNTKYGQTKNVLVRKALEYAVDKNQLLRILHGRGVVANQVIPSSLPASYVTNLPADATYNFNIAKAKALLAQAGYPHGFSTTIYTANHGSYAAVAQALQQMLARIGVKANIDLKDWGTYLTNNETGKQGIFVLGWFEDFPDASDFLSVLLNSNQIPVNNSTNYSNPAVDKLLNDAAVMPDGAARNEKYKEAGIQVMKDAPWIPYTYTTFTALVQPWVKGYYINPNLMDPLSHLWIAAH